MENKVNLIAVVSLMFIADVFALGEFYKPLLARHTSLKLPLDNLNKRIRLPLKEQIGLYGRKFEEIFVYIDGVIGFSPTDLLQNFCPYRPVSEKPNYFIAPYWLHNTDGDVTYFEEFSENGRTIAYAKELAVEINAAFGEGTINPEQITYAVFVTWENMRHSANFESDKLGNSFQIVIVNANGRSYTHFIYRVLNSYSVQALDGRLQECQENAVIGINSGQDYRFDLSGFFFLRRDWVLYFTNERDFQRLGRYVFGLHRFVDQQPLPPRLNCIGDMPDPFCKIAVWNTVKKAINTEFCRYRKLGMYPYPLSCDHFVYCVGNRAFVSKCMTGLHFNPILLVCDWKQHVECNLPNEVIITTNHTADVKKTLTTQTTRHNNFCVQKDNGIFPDSRTCDYYLACSNTRTILKKCPAGLFFRPTKNGEGICDHARNVKCKKGIRTILKAAVVMSDAV